MKLLLLFLLLITETYLYSLVEIRLFIDEMLFMFFVVILVVVIITVNVVVVALLLVIDHIIFTYDQWKGIFHGRSSSREGCDPAKLTFNQRLSSNKGCLLLKVIFH